MDALVFSDFSSTDRCFDNILLKCLKASPFYLKRDFRDIIADFSHGIDTVRKTFQTLVVKLDSLEAVWQALDLQGTHMRPELLSLSASA